MSNEQLFWSDATDKQILGFFPGWVVNCGTASTEIAHNTRVVIERGRMSLCYSGQLSSNDWRWTPVKWHKTLGESMRAYERLAEVWK